MWEIIKVSSIYRVSQERDVLTVLSKDTLFEELPFPNASHFPTQLSSYSTQFCTVWESFLGSMRLEHWGVTVVQHTTPSNSAAPSFQMLLIYTKENEENFFNLLSNATTEPQRKSLNEGAWRIGQRAERHLPHSIRTLYLGPVHTAPFLLFC